MNCWRRNLWLLWVSQLLVLSGFSAAVPFIPLFMRHKLGIADEGELGLAISGFYLCGMASFAMVAPLWGVLADRYGRKIMLLRASIMNALIFPLMAFAPNLTVLLIIRFAAAAFSGTVTAAQTLIVGTTPQDKQGFALGVLSTAIWSGTMLGFMTGGLLVHYFGYTTSFIICGISYVISAIIVLFVKEDFHPVVSPAGKSEKTSLSLDFATWLLLAMFVAIGLLRNFENPYLAVLISKISGDNTAAFWTGMVSAAAALGGVVSGVIFGSLADKHPPLQLLLPALAASGAMLIIQGVSRSVEVLAVARFFAYMAVGGVEPVLQTLLSKITPEERRGRVFGTSTTARSIGMMASSVIAGGAIYYTGVRGVFLLGAILFWLFIPVTMKIVTKIMKLKRLNP